MSLAAPSFLRAVVPPTVRLGGRRLLPMTLGHAVLLRAIGSPFAPYPARSVERGAGNEIQAATRGDVSLARFILSRPWTVARDTMDRRRSRRATILWGLLFARDWMVGALQKHVATEAAVPEFEVLHQGEGRRGAELELVLLDSLIARGYHHDAALNTPLALAWWLHLARFDGEGTLRLAPVSEVPGSESQVPGRKEYPPEVMQAWGEAQQARAKQGRPYDAATDSPEAIAETLRAPRSPLPTDEEVAFAARLPQTPDPKHQTQNPIRQTQPR